MAADIVVLGLGVRPETALADGRRAAAGREPAACSPTCACASAATTNVWAAGDCVEVFDRIAQKHVHIPLGTHANKQGRAVGHQHRRRLRDVPRRRRHGGHQGVRRRGRPHRACGRPTRGPPGFDPLTVTVESTTRAGYFPGAQPLTVKLIAERRSGRLLGAQIVGREGAAKRIDVCAVALWNEMTVEEMTGLDLGYAPPYSPVWDPVLIAARKAATPSIADTRR